MIPLSSISDNRNSYENEALEYDLVSISESSEGITNTSDILLNDCNSKLINDFIKKKIDLVITDEIKIDEIINYFNKPDYTKKNTNKITACPHTYRKHYAKNMCDNCYHIMGRSKKPWQCEHTNKHHYAKGLCQSCYQANYSKVKIIIFRKESAKMEINQYFIN